MKRTSPILDNCPLRKLVAVLTGIIAIGSLPPVLKASELISKDDQGNQATSSSFDPAVSADGRYVAFESSASDLVANDNNGNSDIFVFDRQTETIERVSVGPQGAEATGGDSRSADISADGRFVVFSSSATNLVANDNNGASDVFVHDRTNDTTTRVSVDTMGNDSDGGSFDPAISANGKFVAFGSSATDLIASDANGEADIFVRDLDGQSTEIVSVKTGGNQTTAMFAGTSDPRISDDGRYVVFESIAGDLIDNDTNAVRDIFLRDRTNETTERVSIADDESEATLFCENPDISGDGNLISFSTSSVLVPEDTNGFKDVYIRNRSAATTERASLTFNGGQGNGVTSSNSAFISGDGRFVVFESAATNWVPNDTNGNRDIFVRDRQEGTTLRASVDAVGNQSTGGNSFEPQISNDGSTIVFYSAATNLVPNDNNTQSDVFAIENPPPVAAIPVVDNSALRAALLKKLRKLKKKLKNQRRAKKVAQVKKTRKKIKKIQRQLRTL